MHLPPFANLLLFILLAGCTTSTVEPIRASAPPAAFSAVAVQEVSATDELWKAYAIRVRRALIAELQKTGTFPQILPQGETPVPPNTLIVTSQLTGVDKGDVAARFIIGFGAGRARAAADFVLLNSTGTELAHFTQRKAYSGGIGIGGLDMMDMEDLMDQLGQAAADSITNWTRSGQFE